ncbi:M23 family metallopeptidase [Microvirga terricola]|uniref:Peptidoglycan DD-metalloendopeptidase family protein n=1 Tax=Microvirga terricola TaxID=2719797 RepID=A0ABX0VC26_9HYPH|nr:M23 family metallopeptidase [Microvirga terricola]NIX77248.1 peptidoglycan DD-metalloendopeptidase family protein [Microvirga terricola]
MRLSFGSGLSRIALAGLVSSAVASCSSDTLRFTETPFSNPFSSSDRVAASEPMQSRPMVASVPAAPVQSQALPPVQTQPLSQPMQATAPVPGGASGWSAAGGTQITVGNNDNLNMISQRYGVPASAILAASGLSSPSQVVPGQRVVIPVYNAGGSQMAAAAQAPSRAPQPVAAAQPAGQGKLRFVDSSKAPARGVPEPVDAGKRARPGTAATAQAAPMAKAPATVAAAPAQPLVSTPKPVEAPKVAAVTAPEPVRPAAVAPQAEVAKAPAQDPDQTASVSGEFRWPARGRVIAGFGADGGNEGINIAVPEGTPVKAAEAGTVTYAGSEVKGYGNLVLIRHENGYVSAYAHNGSLSVKRGEQVKRGQVIATSGQSGNVTSPQLHFEIRKGSTPVDPLKHLGG